MTNEIEQLKGVLIQNSSLVGSRQEHIIFPLFTLENLRKLEQSLFQNFGISGKRDVIGLSVLYMLEVLKEIEEKNKTKTNGKESKNI